jgi:hypothetical protein
MPQRQLNIATLLSDALLIPESDGKSLASCILSAANCQQQQFTQTTLKGG